MTPRRIRTTLRLATIPLLVLGLGACTFSFKAGRGSPDGKTSKPAQGGKPIADDGGGSSGKGKPIKDAGGDDGGGGGGSDPGPTSDGPDDPGPTREPTGGGAGDQPRPTTVTTTTTDTAAICRVSDESLEELCHLALDPIAANDLDAWIEVLDDDVVFTRPSHDAEAQRFEGPKAIRKFALKAGGLRELVHVGAKDRVVGTLSNDCRRCRRAFVAFQANTRSGTMVVSLDLGSPAKVFSVEIGSRVQRPHIGAGRKDKDEPSTEIVVPPAENTVPTRKETDQPERDTPKTALQPKQ